MTPDQATALIPIAAELVGTWVIHSPESVEHRVEHRGSEVSDA